MRFESQEEEAKLVSNRILPPELHLETHLPDHTSSTSPVALAGQLGDVCSQLRSISCLSFFQSNKHIKRRPCTISRPFSLQRSPQQGCPLPLLLFTIATESLAMALRAHTGVSVIKILGKDHISLFAEDIIFSIPNLMRLMKYFNIYFSFSDIKLTIPTRVHPKSTTTFVFILFRHKGKENT